MNAETKVRASRHPNLNAALIAAQAEMLPPKKDREVTVKMKTGGTYKFSYATMAGMTGDDRPILAKHGLGFVQFVQDGAMVTRILHESGEHLDCPLPMLNLPNAPQEAGSIITYFKRYSYAAAFGKVAEEEDDANIAAGNSYASTDRHGTINEDQLCVLQGYASAGVIDAQRFCKFFQIPDLTRLPAAKYDEAVRMAKAKAEKQPEMAK